MVSIRDENAPKAAVPEGTKVIPGSPREYLYHNSIDLKFAQLEDDARFRRRVAGSDGATLVGYPDGVAWQNGMSEVKRSAELRRRLDSVPDSRSTVECSFRSTSVESDKSAVPLYKYFSAGNAEAGSMSRSFSPSSDNASYERYCDMLNEAGALRTHGVSLESDLLPIVEAAWKSAAPKRDMALNGTKKSGNVFLKILTTQLVSGTIIGRGGKGLNWFRRKSKVDDILLSMPWELYPKTDYRTLFLKGNTKAVVKATCIIADLMLSKYTAQYAATVTQSDRMLVLVVLPLFFKSAMEQVKEICDPAFISITLFNSNSEHQEIVAVLKGVKSKVKELVAAIANSIAETLDPNDYCHVSYPGPDGFNPEFLPKNKTLSEEGASGAKPVAEEGKEAKSSNHANEAAPATGAEQDSDAENDDRCTMELNEAVHSLEDLVDEDQSGVTKSLSLTTAAAVSETNPSIKTYAVNINILVPASKVADALSITSGSNCYVTTAPADDPDTLLVSLSGSFDETVAVVSLVLSLM